jgi:hypothetical protein
MDRREQRLEMPYRDRVKGEGRRREGKGEKGRRRGTVRVMRKVKRMKERKS